MNRLAHWLALITSVCVLPSACTSKNGKAHGDSAAYQGDSAAYQGDSAASPAPGLLIVQDQWIEPGAAATACTIPGTATSERRSAGVLDLAVLDTEHTHYLLYPLVENLLDSSPGVADGGSATPVEEKNNILVESFQVKLDVVASAGTSITWDSGCPGEFDVPVQTSQLAAGSTVPEMVEIIRPCNAAPLLQSLQADPSTSSLTVTATIWAKGHLGSLDVESPPFIFSVRVCYGCLQTGYSDPTLVPFDFPALPQCSDLTVNPYTGDPCNPAQDVLVLCCATGVDAQGHATAVQCPAIPSGTTP